ncbi:LysR family transcriptional regulator [Xinfangfangia sp. D13-10-4-6]|uniref:LysR family transcriptional regulator n=1 Tax=Pseudogemmobacter hezensis TaxID=2737662 RepID=UPI001551DAD3|nr:LysR family transcriptional regulator [Pseudogemmobacter hezensis]NPD15314.1 LysR family transcriptional regulator [Pseudogemmobacter hezensis]
MELALIRSFVEVAESGSFAAASDRLFVTQSAVSLRIQRLEEQLGRPLFLRSKDGVALTVAGREFRTFANTIMRNWEEARQRVALAEDGAASLALVAPPTLWSGFGYSWIDNLRQRLPHLHLRAEAARSEALAMMLVAGQAQIGLSYAPATRSGLVNAPLFDDQLVMVASWEGADLADMAGRYVLVDWGQDFMRQHQEALPGLHQALLVLSLGALAAPFIAARPCAGYLPARYAKGEIEAKRLYLVAGAPVFTLPAWVIWREDIQTELRTVAQETLALAVEQVLSDTSEALAMHGQEQCS